MAGGERCSMRARGVHGRGGALPQHDNMQERWREKESFSQRMQWRPAQARCDGVELGLGGAGATRVCGDVVDEQRRKGRVVVDCWMVSKKFRGFFVKFSEREGWTAGFISKKFLFLESLSVSL